MAGRLTRRGFLVSAAGAALVTACGRVADHTTSSTSPASIPTETESTPEPTTVALPTVSKFVDQGPSTASQVALTFHTNGDLALAQQLLDITVQRATPITCFIVGNWLEQHPDWAAKLIDAGHELANHTYSHPDSTTLDREQLATEIDRCRDLLVRLTGHPGTYFRPSGVDDGTIEPSSLILETARNSGYETVLGFDVDPLDYQDPGSRQVTARVLDSVAAGSIVSLHFGHAGTVEALPAILDGLESRNLGPVTSSTLLAS